LAITFLLRLISSQNLHDMRQRFYILVLVRNDIHLDPIDTYNFPIDTNYIYMTLPKVSDFYNGVTGDSFLFFVGSN